MPSIVTPGSISDVGSIELVEAIDIDVDAVSPPVEITPDGRASDYGGSKGQYAAARVAGWVPIEWFILWVRPVAVTNLWIIDRYIQILGICRLNGYL